MKPAGNPAPVVAPTITRVEDSLSPRRKRYRIEGGTLTPEWDSLRRPGRVAWCEITIWDDEDRLGSYGGEVWPSAWPTLFRAEERGSGVLLTEAGRAALAEVRS